MQGSGTGIYHDIAHAQNTDREATIKLAHAQKKWLIDYQQEREKK